MQWVLAVKERVKSGYKVKKVKDHDHKAFPIPSPVPFLSPYSPYTHLCLGWVDWALTRMQASGLVESIMRKERGRTAFTHTARQA